MSKAHRSMTTAVRTASALLVSAGVLVAVNASAQSADEGPSETRAEGPVAPTAADPTEAQASANPATRPGPAATTEVEPAADSTEVQAPVNPPATPVPAAATATSAPVPGSRSTPPVYPAGYPYTFHPKPQPDPLEPEGPVTSWHPLRFAVAFESRTSWLRDDGAKRLVKPKRPSAVGVSLQADVLRPRADVALRLDLAWLDSSSSSYQSGSSLVQRLESNLFSLGIALRYQLLRWLAPFVRASGGLGWDKLTVAELHDRQLFAHGTIGAGLALRGPGLLLWHGDHVPFLGLVGHIEGGYAMAAGGDFVLHGDVPSSSEKPIPTSDVRLGRIERNAPYLRVSLGLAF